MVRPLGNPIIRTRSTYRADDEMQPDLLPAEDSTPPKQKEGEEPDPLHISREEIMQRAEEVRSQTLQKMANRKPKPRRKKDIRDDEPTDEELRAIEG